MKRTSWIVLFLCIAGSITAGIHSYATRSVLADGNFVKIKVAESGVVRITYDELRQMGLTPENVRVFGYGGAMLSQNFLLPKIDDLPAVPFYMEKGSDGKFGQGDYILFYAQGPVSWRYTGTRFIHTRNTYSNYGYYFLSDNAGKPLTLQRLTADVSSADAFDVTTYPDYQVHEVDSLNLVDKAGKEGGGREWYGERIEVGLPLTLNFTFPALRQDSQLYACVDAAPDVQVAGTFRIKVGTSEKSVSVAKSAADIYTKALTLNTDGYFAAQAGNTQTVVLSYLSSTNAAGAYLNYVELTGISDMVLQNGYLRVRNVEHYLQSRPTRFHIRQATATTQVWNITRLDSIYSVPVALVGNELSFLADNNEVQEFVVIDPAQYSGISPVQTSSGIDFERIANQNLHAMRNVDMVILTNKRFLEASQRLAKAHADDGLVTEVVTADEVYNEFSSGTPDATAYRWVMKMLYDRAEASGGKENAPRFLLLMGDGTYDNRKLLYNSGQNILLTYQALNSTVETYAYATDDYFGFLDDQTGQNELTDQMAISVGRLPVQNESDADAMVDKIIRYMRSTSRGAWQTHLCFLADDGDGNGHTRGADKAAEVVRKANPDFIVDKIYIDAYQQMADAAGEHYPLAKNKLDNLLSSGVLFFDYCGHAGYNNLSSEQMLTAKEIREMHNEHQGFWMLATCSFGRFDAHVVSAAEEAVLNADGGAIGLLASCRTVYETQNERLNESLCKYLFTRSDNGKFAMTIGEAVKAAKNDYASYWRDKNKLPYILLCDPALRLLYPDDFRVSVSQFPDTLKALAKHTITGCVLTHEGDTATDFNGKVQVTLFDKMQQITTNDNDQGDEDKKQRYTYVDYPNTLFNGTAQVSEGKFNLSFMVPKDIRYNYGNGHLVLYANDTVFGGEGVGYKDDFLVGGGQTQTLLDTVGPDLRIWLNNPAFADGGTTSTQPHFYASIKDANGINTIGNGIGHDMLLVIDDDISKSYILNDYFTARSGSYQEGMVSYRLSELAEGDHTLSFRVWDLLNNSTTATLSFHVVADPPPTIFSAMAYPNPVEKGAWVTIGVEHDCPDVVLKCVFLMYDMAGRLVWQHEQTGADKITFSPAAVGMHAGTYFYRVRIKTDSSEYTSKTGKLMVY